MKKFEVGKVYRNDIGTEIKVVKRTKKTITFIFTAPYKNFLEKEYKKKILDCYKDCESIRLMNFDELNIVVYIKAV